MRGSRAVHAQCEEVVERRAAWGDPRRMSPAEFRAMELVRYREMAMAPRPLASVADVRIPGPDGDIDAIAYRPAGSCPGVLVWFHGGAFIGGSPRLSDDQARELAAASGCVVVSVDYPLAPEHPFPAPVHACLAAVRWAAREAAALGAGAGLAIGGDSAGGNLAAAVTLLARDAGEPRIDFQLLVYPVTCFEIDTSSRRENGERPDMLRHPGAAGYSHYLRTSEDAADPLASPLLAPSHAGLPPALIVTAEHDPLRDEGELYAKRLAVAGVPVAVRRYDGMIHGFWAYAGVIDAAQPALRFAGEAVRAALGGTAAGRGR
jgi:acetyl esterase